MSRTILLFLALDLIVSFSLVKAAGERGRGTNLWIMTWMAACLWVRGEGSEMRNRLAVYQHMWIFCKCRIRSDLWLYDGKIQKVYFRAVDFESELYGWLE